MHAGWLASLRLDSFKTGERKGRREDDANEKGRDEKGTSGSRPGVPHLQKDAVNGKDDVAK